MAGQPSLVERYRGTMVGLAVGNALGIEVEGLSPDELRALLGDRLGEIPARERDRPWDDDVAQAVILAEALLGGDGLDIDDLAGRLVRWAKESGRGMGVLTGQVLARLARGTPASEAARAVWDEGNRTSAGNGAVMRCPPVALRWSEDRARLVAETLVSASVTHADPRCGWTAVALNLAIADLLHGREVDLVGLASAASEMPAEVSAAIMAMRTASLEDLDLSGPAMGYTVKTMQVGLWAACTEHQLEDALVTVIAAGGDTDTNGAVAGAVLGARHGIEAIPARWRDAIHGGDRLVELAEALLAAAEETG
jgi:ADP-ribosyl-[dinitrogen reductase] hydrolase